jgi:predicted tellurium resistance membrane protein TerC
MTAVGIIVVADTVMSLDNMLAVAAAAQGSVVLVVFGLALSVPLIIFGASLLATLFARFPVLVWAGSAVLGYVAGELFGSERLLAAFAWARWAYWDMICGFAGIVFVLATAYLLRRYKSEKAPA